MAINRYKLSEDLKAKELNYIDDFFKLKSEKIIPSDSFSYNSYVALTDINDFSTNNYSNLFLSKKIKTSEWLEANVKKNISQLDIISTLSFYGNNPQDDEKPGVWLFFDKNYEMWDANVSTISYKLVKGRPLDNYTNYIFHLDFIDDSSCRISHTFGDTKFNLHVDETLIPKFSKYDDENTIFYYNLDEDKLRLYKKVLHKTYDEVGDVVPNSERYELYSISCTTLDGEEYELKLSKQLETDNSNLIFLTNNILDMDFYLDSSWVSYNRGNSIDSIDRNRSEFNLETQTLLHHQYNNEDEINFIPLKNNLTYKGNSIRGNNLTISPINVPDVDFRNYTSINSGLKQEKGNDNIILNFTFNDQEYEISEGDDLFIYIPTKEESNYVEPLWPYTKINIKDTKFIKNGAFGSDTPAFADKFKRMQGPTSSINTDTGNRNYPNNGTYLCTWLFKPTHESEAMWLDRYYYPERELREEIVNKLSEVYDKKSFEGNFNNIIENVYVKNETYGEIIKKKISQHVFYDKVSDVMIEPGCSYKYSRLSKEMVEEKLQSIDDNLIKVVKNQSNKDVYPNELMLLNNENYLKLNHKLWNKTNSINFNTDIYLDSKKKIGMQIFGTDYAHGFNIQNRKDLCPFHYYASDETIYLLNNKFEIVHQFNVYEKYEDHIIKYFCGDVFDDVILISGIHMYILSYDLRLKTRISFIGGRDDKLSIYKLDDISLLDDSVVNDSKTNTPVKRSLINFPYDNNSKTISNFKIYNKPSILTINTNSLKKKVTKPFTPCSRFIALKHFREKKLIPSHIVELISENNPMVYKNNLYLPFNQDILKIILCPDCDLDRQVFTEKIREDYPAAARLLSSEEYHLNYIKSNSSSSDYETVSLESGFIQVKNKIKNLYIDSEDRIFGFNYDRFAISPDGDTIYGLYADLESIERGEWYWLFNQSLSKMIGTAGTSKYAEFASPNSIDFVRFNSLGEMALVRNFRNLPDNENDDNNKRLDIYDKTKKKIYTYDLSSYDEVISLDSFNYIDEAHRERTNFVLLAKAAGMIYVVRYISNDRKMEAFATQLPFNHSKKFIETTNSNSMLRYGNNNSLFFNLHVPSPYLYDYITTVKWNIDDIQTGWYNINVSVDLEKAIFEVRINDNIFATVTENEEVWFKPHVYSKGTTFDTTYYFGCIGKRYGTTLNKILNNGFYDPYVCKNSKIENLTIYNKALSYGEYQAMRLKDKDINKLIITLPCGTRNSIDEITRYFKYNTPGAISNKIKLNISGTGLESEGEFELLRKEILSTLEKDMDCLTKVKEIEFI